MFQWFVLLYGFLLAAIDSLVFPLLKLRYLNIIHGIWPIIISFFLYGGQALLFYKSLSYETMTVMNIFWNMASNILITTIGIFGLKEHLSLRKILAIVIGFVSMYLLLSDNENKMKIK
jgi:drug/metabolite transporter (DMT)-like permease